MKRVLDLLASVILLALLALLIAVIAAAVRLKLGSPVLFRQVRPGLHGKPFTILKFRTMVDDRDGDGRILPDEERLTSFGRLLRSSSLDELPELWNVLRGDMSLVGPRPLLMQYVTLYTPEQMRRHDVRPGLTGWAQVNGRNSLDWEDKFQLDTWYVDHQSLRLDIRILFLTAKSVLGQSGISHAESATMPEFRGTAAPPDRNRSKADH